jgi:hypothetical protein
LLVLPEPLALVARVEGEPGGPLGGLGGFPTLMVLADRDQPRHRVVDELQEPAPPLGIDRLHGESGREDRPRCTVGCIEQPDRLARLRRLPGKAAHEDAAEMHPSFEQPEAAGRGGLEPSDHRRGIIGLGEQPAAQLGGLVDPTAFVGVVRFFDDVGQAGCLGAIGAFELPGGPRRLLDQDFLGVIAGPEVGGKGVEAPVVGVDILAGQDDGLGAHAVLQRIESRAILPLGGLRAAALSSIATPGLGPVRRGRLGGRGRGGGHGGIGPRCKIGGSRGVAGGEDQARLRARNRSYRLWYIERRQPTGGPNLPETLVGQPRPFH